MPRHTLYNDAILSEVFRAMQPAEEIWGPDGDDYIALMESIATEAKRRIDAYRASERPAAPPAPAAPAPIPTVPTCRACFCPEEPGAPLITVDLAGPIHEACHYTSDAHDRMSEESSRHEIQRGILTVGQLRRAIAGLPDSIQVVVDGHPLGRSLEWMNVPAVIVPSRSGDDYAALTLEVADTFDPRQF